MATWHGFSGICKLNASPSLHLQESWYFMSVITLVFFIMFSILLYMLFGGHAGGGRCTGFLFPLFWTLQLGRRGIALQSQESLPRGTRAPPLTLDLTEPWNWRSHVLMSNKCLSDKIWLLTFGVLSYFTWLLPLFLSYWFMSSSKVKIYSYQNIFTYILYLFYSLPQLDVFIWMLSSKDLGYLWNERLCALVFNFKTFICLFLFVSLIFTCDSSIVLGEIHFDSVPMTFFPLNFFISSLKMNCLYFNSKIYKTVAGIIPTYWGCFFSLGCTLSME